MTSHSIRLRAHNYRAPFSPAKAGANSKIKNSNYNFGAGTCFSR